MHLITLFNFPIWHSVGRIFLLGRSSSHTRSVPLQGKNRVKKYKPNVNFINQINIQPPPLDFRPRPVRVNDLTVSCMCECHTPNTSLLIDYILVVRLFFSWTVPLTLVGVWRRDVLSGWDEDVIAEVAVVDGETVTCAVSRRWTPTDRLLLLHVPHHDTEHTPHTLTSYTIHYSRHLQHMTFHSYYRIQQVYKERVLVLKSTTDTQFTQYTVFSPYTQWAVFRDGDVRPKVTSHHFSGFFYKILI